jgi:deoxyhypusine synthase
MSDAPVSHFVRHHFRHFNGATLVDAADAYAAHLADGGGMMVTLAGAMSTAELGLSLAEMIRQDKVQAITCTGANLEEDVFNLVAHDHYVRIPNYRDLTADDEEELLARHLNRVTDTCIPEEEAIRRIEQVVLEHWLAADAAGERYFPHEFMYQVLLSGKLEEHYQIDPKDSWLLAAAQKNLPIIVPGWEDSTLGNVFAGHCITGEIKNVHTVRGGIEYMTYLAAWYQEQVKAGRSIGFYQIGGGIAGDADARAGPADKGRAAVGLLLPDQRLDDQLRLLLGRGAKREDHLGQAVGGHAQVHHRVGRDHRGAADVRHDPGVVRTTRRGAARRALPPGSPPPG